MKALIFASASFVLLFSSSAFTNEAITCNFGFGDGSPGFGINQVAKDVNFASPNYGQDFIADAAHGTGEFPADDNQGAGGDFAGGISLCTHGGMVPPPLVAP